MCIVAALLCNRFFELRKKTQRERLHLLPYDQISELVLMVVCNDDAFKVSETEQHKSRKHHFLQRYAGERAWSVSSVRSARASSSPMPSMPRLVAHGQYSAVSPVTGCGRASR